MSRIKLNDLLKINKAYLDDDVAITSLDDNDHFPVYDSINSERKRITWSDIKSKLKLYFDTLYPAKSHVGMVIHTTTLDTEAKVKEVYGGTTWIQLSGYVLRGATGSVTANQNLNDGGADSVTVSSVASHNHSQNSHNHTQNSHNHTQNSHGHGNPTGTDGAAYHANTTAYNKSVILPTSDMIGSTKGEWMRYLTPNNTTATNNAQTATNNAQTATNNANGANYTVNTLPKYKNVYIWERTA